MEHEIAFLKQFKLDDIISKLEEGFTSVSKVDDFKKYLDKHYEKGSKPITLFSGIRIHICNGHQRKPFFRAKLDIRNANDTISIAWYELEYDFKGNILDDYFDVYE